MGSGSSQSKPTSSTCPLHKAHHSTLNATHFTKSLPEPLTVFPLGHLSRRFLFNAAQLPSLYTALPLFLPCSPPPHFPSAIYSAASCTAPPSFPRSSAIPSYLPLSLPTLRLPAHLPIFPRSVPPSFPQSSRPFLTISLP